MNPFIPRETFGSCEQDPMIKVGVDPPCGAVEGIQKQLSEIEKQLALIARALCKLAGAEHYQK